MTLAVFLAVILAAAMHAGWNAILKIRLDPFLAVVLINAWCVVIALPMVFVFGAPRLEAWPWLIASAAVHLLYSVALTKAYRLADMGKVYPVARGSAPLMTALVSLFALGESLGPLGFAGVAMIALGIMSMALRSGRLGKRALGFAIATGVTITAYTLLDGIGARAAGNPHTYTAWLFILDGFSLVALALARHGISSLAPMRSFLAIGFFGAVMSLAAYWIAIWAMTEAPIGLVAAVRESSVLFGAVIAVAVLREPIQANRIVAACLILSGLVLIRLH